MKPAVFVCFSLFTFCLGQVEKSPQREQRILSVFQIVKFKNEACNASESTQGVCYTTSECNAKGGSVGATCASGFGVCCIFTKGCGTVTSENNTYFVSTDFVSPCELKVCKSSSDICQLRLNFDSFDAPQPSTTVPSITNCIDSRFSVSSDGPQIPIICGTNSGDHMYVEASESCNILQMMTLPGTTTPNFKIRIGQIPCTAPFKAPDGCLQFFTGTTGSFRSFNFVGGTHLANQDVSHCIRTEEGYCTITYAATEFDLTTGRFTENTSCTEDYVVLLGKSSSDRVCGGAFRTPTATQRPWVVVFHSDGTDAANDDRAGYSLTYTQSTDNCL